MNIDPAKVDLKTSFHPIQGMPHSQEAAQGLSPGPVLGQAVILFSQFVWQIDYPPHNAQFAHHTSKQQLVNTLTKTFDPAVQTSIKPHLEALSLDQLHSLQPHLTPGTLTLIQQKIESQPHAVQPLLASLAKGVVA